MRAAEARHFLFFRRDRDFPATKQQYSETPSQEIPGSGYPIVTTRMPGEIIARTEAGEGLAGTPIEMK